MNKDTQKYSYKYERPALTVDCIVFGYKVDEGLNVLLIKRNLDPFKDAWALPGGFVRINESVDEAALRELKEEAGIENVYLEQLYSFGEVDRDPSQRVVTIAYYALVNLDSYHPHAGTDAQEALWYSPQELPTLAFDHKKIIDVALSRLKAKIRYEPIGFELLPEKFPFSSLEHLFQTITQEPIDRRNFRKKMLKNGVLIQLEEKQEGVRHKRGFLYQFDAKKYKEMKNKGIGFEI